MNSDGVQRGKSQSPNDVEACPAITPEDAETAGAHSRADTRAAPAPLLALLAAAAALAICSWYIGFEEARIVGFLNGQVGLVAAIGIHVLTLCLIAAFGIVVSNVAWRHPARRRASGAAGLVFVFSVVSLIFQVANAASFATFARDNYWITLAVDSSEDANVTVLTGSRVRIDGTIGPNLMRDFMALERTSGPLLGLEINSPGGLVDEALKLARFVEKARIPVIVRYECLSACVLVAVASPASYAEEGAIFGFHQTAPVADITSEIAIFGMAEADKEANSFMRDHGVPEEVLREANRYEPDSMYLMTASEMVEAGTIEGILPNE
jgi:ATP-dependent protease ClpP protease subunit